MWDVGSIASHRSGWPGRALRKNLEEQPGPGSVREKSGLHSLDGEIIGVY